METGHDKLEKVKGGLGKARVVVGGGTRVSHSLCTDTQGGLSLKMEVEHKVVTVKGSRSKSVVEILDPVHYADL